MPHCLPLVATATEILSGGKKGWMNRGIRPLGSNAMKEYYPGFRPPGETPSSAVGTSDDKAMSIIMRHASWGVRSDDD